MRHVYVSIDNDTYTSFVSLIKRHESLLFYRANPAASLRKTAGGNSVHPVPPAAFSLLLQLETALSH